MVGINGSRAHKMGPEEANGSKRAQRERKKEANS